MANEVLPAAPVTPAQIDQLSYGPRVREALKLVVSGQTYRDAAQEVGLAVGPKHVADVPL